MSINRSLILLTQEEWDMAEEKLQKVEGESLLYRIDSKNYFWYGNGSDDVPSQVLEEIERLKPKVDDVAYLLTFLFLQGSESQQLDMFERFLSANLGKGKIVHFWSE